MIWASLEEQSILTSASKTILLPSGQMTWSTRGLTCTHFRSKDRRPAWDIGIYSLTPNHSHIEAYTRTHNICIYQIYLTAGVSHVADYAAILHFVQMFSHHNIFIPCREAAIKKTDEKEILIKNNILIVFLFFFKVLIIGWQQSPVQVMTMSICLTISLSLITLKPSMLSGVGDKRTGLKQYFIMFFFMVWRKRREHFTSWLIKASSIHTRPEGHR